MARFFPQTFDADAPLSEILVREALEMFADDWLIFSNIRWLAPKEAIPDGELDFFAIHPVHGGLVLEAKSGSYALRDGAWWIVDGKGTLRTLGRRTPIEQATSAKHELRRRLRGHCPALASRLGHVVCFTNGAPDGRLGPDAPPEIVLSGPDLPRLEARLVAAAQFFGISLAEDPLPAAELEAASRLLAPQATIQQDAARAVATFRQRMDARTAVRIQLTEQQRAALMRIRSERCSVVYGPAGTGKTVLAVRRALELLRSGARVVVVCSSPSLVGFYRDELHGEWSGSLAVARISALLQPDVDVLAADAMVIDEAQNLSRAHLARLSELASDQISLDLFCDVGQIRHAQRRAEWAVPFPHVEQYLLENLRNSGEIVDALRLLGYEGVAIERSRSDLPLEFVECRDGAEMRAAAVEIAYDLIRAEGLREGQVAILTEAPLEMASLLEAIGLATSTDVWAFGRPSRARIDVGSYATFQGLERDVVVVMEPTEATSPPALDRPSGASSLPWSDLAHDRDDLDQVVRMSLSRARSRAIIIGGAALRRRLGLPRSDRPIRAEARGRKEVIEIWNVVPGRAATARATRRTTPAQDGYHYT